MGPRGTGASAATRGATTSPIARRANLGQRRLGPAPVGAFPAGVSAYGCHAAWSATCGSGRRRTSAPYPGFALVPVPGVLRGVLRPRLQGAAGRLVGHRTPARSGPRSATGTTPSAARSSPASAARGTRPSRMCRFVAYLGPPVSLDELLLQPPHSLLRQSWAPRQQSHGVVNADGFGVGWYDKAVRPEPALYRSDRPMWADRTCPAWPRVTRSTAVLAAVRSATPPLPVEEPNSPPFADGPWLFAHNGGGRRLRAAPRRCGRDRRLAGHPGHDRQRGGVRPRPRPPRRRRRRPPMHCGRRSSASRNGRLNLVLTDGVVVVATACGDSLFVRSGGGVVVASEPFDDEPGWEPVPDRSLVEATAELASRTAAAREHQGRRPPRARDMRRRPPGRRPVRAHVAAEGAAAQVVLRRPRGRSSSTRSPGCPSTTRPAPSGRSSRSSPHEIAAAAKADTLVELGSGTSEKTAAAARRHGRHRPAAPVRAVRRERGDAACRRRSAIADRVPGPRRARRGRRLRAPPADGPRGRAQAGRLPGRHHRQPRARAEGRVLGRGRRHAGAGRLAAARHRPGEGPGPARGRLRRQRGRHRRVQPQRAPGAEPRARRRLRRRPLRPRRPLGRGRGVDRDAASLHRRAAGARARARTGWSSPSPTARRCAPRSAPSSAGPGSRPSLAPRA